MTLYLIIPVAAEVPRIDTLLKPSGAPQPMNNNLTTRVVIGAGDISPEGGVTAQAGILGGEHLDTVIALIR